MSKQERTTDKCCICGCKIHGYGNNAMPFMKGTCCDACNYLVVIPMRLKKGQKR